MEQPNKQYDLSVIKFKGSALPEFREVKDVDWVIYGAEKKEKKWYNNYPAFLEFLRKNSATHNAIIANKVNYIAGNGFDIDTSGLTTLDQAKLLEMLKTANKYDETAGDIAFKVTWDFVEFGGAYVEIAYAKNGKNFDYYHMPYNSLRLDVDCEGFWYSNDWSKPKDKQTEEDTELEYIPLWTPESEPKGRYIMWLREYSPDMKYYPLPEYIGAINYIQCDYEISNYHLNNIRSNFFIGTIINFNNGKPDEPTKAYIEETLDEKFGGTDNAGRHMVTFNTNKENAPTIEHLAPSELDKQFTILKTQVEQSIFIGHFVNNPALMGVITDKGFVSGREQIFYDDELYKSGYVIPKQKKIERFFNKILELKGFNGRVKLKEKKPINERLSEGILEKILTQNELRKIAGYPPIEGGDGKQPEEAKPVISSAVHHFDSDYKCEHHFEDEEEYQKVMNTFREYAKKKEEYEIVMSKEWENLDEAFAFEKQYFAEEDEIPEGELKPKKKKSEIGELKILYSYEARAGLKDIIPTTREFCRDLIDINGLYSRADIGRISSLVGWDVWKHRGGWWTRKGTNYTTDFCRHIWKSHIVRKKNG